MCPCSLRGGVGTVRMCNLGVEEVMWMSTETNNTEGKEERREIL